jgi:23S rRNA (cytosine1962-C5)-methyltransferase
MKRTRKPRRRSQAEHFTGEPVIGSKLLQQRPLAVDGSAAIPAVWVKSATYYPLLYRKRIARVEGAKPGDLVAVYGPGDRILGYGLYNARSEIAVRMLWHTDTLPDDAAWREKLDRAVGLRRGLLRLDEVTDSYRVVHAESDGFSGLMIDKLGDVLSAEAFSLGMYQRAQAILDRLAPELGTQHTLVRTSPQFVSQEGYDPPPLASPDLPPQVTIQEFGTRFRVRFEGGHKTGFFCDQRDNRRMLAGFCQGKTVLDLCCYTGGFAVQAMKLGGAAEATGVDLDEEPLALAKENANLNQVRVKFAQADAFAYMRDMLQNGRQYDVVVLDPPKLIRTRQEIEEGTRKHFALNKLAMQLVKPGGLLLSCTCAGLLPEQEFVQLLVSASRQAGPETSPATADKPARHAARSMQIIARTGAAACHPVGSNCLETEYLNAVWMVMG